MEKKNLNNEELPDRVYCPICKKEICSEICFDISMTADGLAPERTISNEIKSVDNYKNICKKCKYHDV